jgi:hypothetical protein
MESMSRQVLVSTSMIHRFRSGTLKEARRLTLPSARVWRKLGLDDYLAFGHTKDDLEALVPPHPPKLLDEDRRQTYEQNNWQAKPEHPRAEPITLDAAHTIFKRWLGTEYDLDALDAVLAAAAVERLGGDPLWLLLVSGSGNAKTETVQALDGMGASITSTISSPAALLSGTSRRDTSNDATGGPAPQAGHAWRVGDQGCHVAAVHVAGRARRGYGCLA